MNRSLSVLVALALVPAALPAQVGNNTNLVLSMFGGVSAGHALWSIGRQPLCVLLGGPPNYNGCAQSSSGDVADTLAMARDVSSSLMLGAGVSLYPNPYVGFQGEIYYLGLSYDDRCSAVSAYQSDPENKNQQVCQNFGRTGASASAVAFIGGVVLRASPRHRLSPYVRAGIGLTSYSGGTLAVSGQFADNSAIDPTTNQPYVIDRTIVVDTTPKTTSFTFQLGAGFTAAIAPAYQLRFELRDAILPLERLIGPANDFGQAPHETKFYHHVGFTIGLDIVLEHRRGHRY